MDHVLLTMLLARVWGLYLIITGVLVLVNRRALVLALQSMSKEKFSELVTAMILVLGGLFYVIFYHDWSSLPAAVISLIGWIVLLKGLAYAFMSEASLKKFARNLTTKSWYTIDGIIAIVVGLYLAGTGFGLW